MKKLLLTLLVGMLAGADLAAQSIAPKTPFVLNLDYARFRNDNASGYLEVYYGFYPSLLTYAWSEGKYRAGVILSTRVTKAADDEVVFSRRAHLKIEEADTSGVWYRYPFITQAGFALPFGDYVLSVLAVDSLNISRRDSLTLPIQIVQYPDSIAVSDIELCKKVARSRRQTDLFYKNSLEVIPNPSLVFGVATSPVVFDYVELYNVEPEKKYTVKTLIIDGSGKVVRTSSRPRKYQKHSAVEVGTTMITAVPSGRYVFRMMLLDQENREVARADRTFFVYNPHLDTASAPEVGVVEKQLEGYTTDQLDSEFRQARYIATDQEARMFAQLTTTEAKRKFLAKFWADAQRGRFEWGPVSRVEYLRRVKAADELYSSLSKQGWRTDRGRVYILYGRPDEIERFPSLGETKPYQIWHYYRIENGVVFVFVDRSGYGDYELVHSTKRGELRDDNWERFLR